MSFYVVANRSDDGEVLDCPLFESSNGTSAAVVFLSEQSASDFIEQAGWQNGETAAELKPMQLLTWLVMLRDKGVDHVAIDPNRDGQLAGKPQPALPLDDPYQAHTMLLNQLIDARPETSSRHS